MRFTGRATRSEFWWFAPVALIPPAVAATMLEWKQVVLWIRPLLGPMVLTVWILALLLLVPLHIIAIVFSVMTASSVLGMTLVPSETGRNRFGPNPFEAAR